MNLTIGYFGVFLYLFWTHAHLRRFRQQIKLVFPNLSSQFVSKHDHDAQEPASPRFSQLEYCPEVDPKCQAGA